MRSTVLVCALLVFVTCSAAQEVNVIYQHNEYYNNPNDPDYPFFDIGANGQVVIFHGVAGEPFEFEAAIEDPADPDGPYQGPGDIRSIIAQEGAGPVTITIVGYGVGHAYGARDVGEINLYADGVTGVIGNVTLSHALATQGPVVALAVAGAVHVGEYEEGCEGPSLNGDIGNDIVLDELIGEIGCRTLKNVTIAGDASYGDIFINYPWGDSGDPEHPYTISVGEAVGGNLRTLYFCASASGDIKVGGNLYMDMESGEGADLGGTVWVGGAFHLFDVRHVTATVDMGEFAGMGIRGDFSGSVTVHGPVSPAPGVSFSVAGQQPWNGDWTGTFNVQGDFGADIFHGTMEGGIGDWTHGPMAGVIQIDGNCYGRIAVGYYNPDTNPVYILRDVTGSVEIAGDLAVLLKINCNLYGNIDIGGSLVDTVYPDDPNYPPAGRIQVARAFAPDPEEPATPAHITIGGGLTSSDAFIAVNYDGWGGEAWNADCPVTLEHGDDPDEVFYGNSPASRIWAIICKGNMNNDDEVGFADINPFVAALSDPDGYAQSYPALAAAMNWHGDMNCDGAFGFADINPFVARITQDCCIPECGNCPGDGLMLELEPEALAEILKANVSDELYESMVTLVAESIAAQNDEAGREYSLAVYDALME